MAAVICAMVTPNAQASEQASDAQPRAAVAGNETRAKHSKKWAWLLRDEDGGPVRWNPCQTITWSWPGARSSDKALMRKAVSELSRATRIPFAYVRSRPEIRVAYSRAVSGYGQGGASFGSGGYYARGYVSITSRFKKKSYVSANTRYATYLHELGHAIGLGHVSSRKQIMYPTILGRVRHYQAGDLHGLRVLGRASGCIAEPTAPRNMVGRVVTISGTDEDGPFSYQTLRLTWTQNVALTDGTLNGGAIVLGPRPYADDGSWNGPTCVPGRVQVNLEGKWGFFSGTVPYTCAS